MNAPFRVGLLGLGHVGGAVARRLIEDRDRIARAAGRPITLEAISVRSSDGRSAPSAIIPADALLARPGLDAVVELIGGLEPAHTYIDAALRAGRQVITANKQVIATYGPDLAALGPIRFEAAVASAVPIIEILTATLAADEIRSITGILNGTTNFMLDMMATGVSYADALADAQRQGFAEADPSADVDAHDPAAKLAILAMLAFRRRIDPSTIQRVGIRELGVREGRSSGGGRPVVKLVAAARVEGSGIGADVRPRVIPEQDVLARTEGAMNTITIDASYAGRLVLAGPGAGPDAAASAVLADLVNAARGTASAAGAALAELANQPAASVSPLGSRTPYEAAS